MTSSRFASLRDIARLDLDVVDVERTAEYPIAGVYGFGRGLIDRGVIRGSETSYSRLQRLRSGQVVFSRLKAFEGAVAVVRPEFDGFFVSQEFPTFTIDESRASIDYVAHLCRWPDFWSSLRSGSKGIGARRERLHADEFLALEIPLPPIDEQRRIVGAMQRLRVLVAPIVKCAAGGQLLSSSLTTAMARPSGDRSGWEQVALGAVIAIAIDPVAVEPLTEYPNVGVYSFARGLFGKPPIDGSNTSARRLYRIRSGQFIYSRLFAFEGAYASVPDRFDGYYVSNEFPAFDVDSERADVGFLTAYFSARDVWERVSEGSKGLGVRRQRVQQEQLLKHVLQLPPLEEQQRIGRVAARLSEVGTLRARASVLATAIEPSVLNRAFAGLA